MCDQGTRDSMSEPNGQEAAICGWGGGMESVEYIKLERYMSSERFWARLFGGLKTSATIVFRIRSWMISV